MPRGDRYKKYLWSMSVLLIMIILVIITVVGIIVYRLAIQIAVKNNFAKGTAASENGAPPCRPKLTATPPNLKTPLSAGWQPRASPRSAAPSST